jgi:hypothetical protein
MDIVYIVFHQGNTLITASNHEKYGDISRDN